MSLLDCRTIGNYSPGTNQSVIFRDLMPDIPSTTYATFGLYKYPAEFIPQVIAYALTSYGRPGMSVIDPFAGYGTVGTVARLCGNDYELWDLNPLLKYLHSVAIMHPIEIDSNALVQDIKYPENDFYLAVTSPPHTSAIDCKGNNHEVE